MSSKDAHLYGAPRPKKAHTANKDLSTTSSLAFSTALSSLISSTASSTPNSISTLATGRPRPSRTKPDIFTSHNRNTKKRAAADMLAQTQADDEAKFSAAKMDDASWRRTKRKMEEKARLYAAMKRGDVEDADEKHMVDFDRKWAEKERDAGSGGSDEEDDEEGSAEEEEVVEFEDEFGRTRRGTRAEAAREERRRRMVDQARAEPDRFTARPVQPRNIILGDTIQAAAFNPEEPVAAQMEELAAKRDREATPPEAVHYDANAEIRNKGTGFFQFSGDEEVRREQMEGLERERRETERMRVEREREGRMEARKREVEERRRLIREKRGKVQAERFLDELGKDMLGGDHSGR